MPAAQRVKKPPREIGLRAVRDAVAARSQGIRDVVVEAVVPLVRFADNKRSLRMINQIP